MTFGSSSKWGAPVTSTHWMGPKKPFGTHGYQMNFKESPNRISQPSHPGPSPAAQPFPTFRPALHSIHVATQEFDAPENASKNTRKRFNLCFFSMRPCDLSLIHRPSALRTHQSTTSPCLSSEGRQSNSTSLTLDVADSEPDKNQQKHICLPK